ncbi:hypothetical protein K439DRAFT_1524119 [Ramaria rubella]|nr:hypothetical protein K439DRAFT_1524119 [Ramaria rubella]
MFCIVVEMESWNMSGILYINSCTRTNLTIPHSLPQQLYKQYFLTMSSQAELAALIQEQSDSVTFNYVTIASFTLLAYDILLTFPSEVRFIWHKKFRLSTILYLLTRYPTLREFLVNVYGDFAAFSSLQPYNRTCNSLLYFTNALAFLPVIGVQVITNWFFVVLAFLGTAAIVLLMQTIIAYPLLIFLPSSEWDSRAAKKHFVKVACPARYSEIWALRPTLQGILGHLKNCLSTIIICHFHLDLQQRNDHPNGSNTSHSLPLGSFHAVKEKIHRAVVDEFGDLSFNDSFGTEGSQEDIELQDMQSPSGVAEIDRQEFPWAGGDIGDEEAGPVASGSGILTE